MNQHWIEWNGKKIKVKAIKKKDQLWYSHEGRVYCYSVTKKKRGASASDAANDGNILSPMPGKIMKIVSNPGESVKEGQLILVMEAMKMEYSINAPFDGVLSDVLCAVGDQTKLGDKIAIVERVEA